MATIANLATNDLIDEAWVDSVTNAINNFDAWTAYTPTFGGTLGNGSLIGKYLKIGKTCWWWAQMTWGTTSNMTSATLGLPFTPASLSLALTSVVMVGGGGAASIGTPALSGSTIIPLAQNASGTYLSGSNISNTVPFTWGAGNTLSCGGVFETT